LSYSILTHDESSITYRGHYYRWYKIVMHRPVHEDSMDDNLGIPNLAARQLRSRDIIRLEAGKTQRPASPRASLGGLQMARRKSQVT
jgi:hypothetical protein